MAKFPLRLTIPTPSPIERGQGIDGTTVGDNVRVRTTLPEKEVIEQAVEILGVTKSQYLRWCGVYAAHALLRELGHEGKS